jgi:phosphatidylglycerol:prolipoprotein diacylglycerol transferase
MAQAIGRVGCLLNGCCYGTPTTLPWGLEYTNSQSLGKGAGITHPTVVYEIIFNVLAFVALLKLRGKFKPEGSLYLIYLTLYSGWRLGIDFLRDGTPFLFGLHQAQVISIIILLIAVPWMAMNTRLAKPEPEPEPPVPVEKSDVTSDSKE